MSAGIQVKICGVNSPAAFDAVVEGAADYLGFVFFERSPRCVTPAQAASLSARHAGGPKRVGLFVGPDAKTVQAVLDRLQLDILQLYGSAVLCRDIQARFALPAWRAIGVAEPAELPGDAQGLAGFVIEAKAPAGATRPGGNATALDWDLLAGWKAPGFWLLGGGLRPDNVACAIRQSAAPAVDVSSGVESAPGEKSPALIRKFIASVKNAGQPAATEGST
jgi:phosphoribosylanthranilate isomerase